MSELKYDLVIAGGGIAGSALATVMARAGKSVLVLEKTTEYPDLVRGEWIPPWGVVEAKRTGLLDVLVDAGGHYLTRHIGFGEGIDPEKAIARALDMSTLLAGVPGPLCLRHPVACQALTDAAEATGATVRRGVTRVALEAGPSLRYTHEGAEHTATGRLVVGADGRNSVIRGQAGIALHRDPTHHLFSGMLVEGAHGWPDDAQTKGTEGDVNFLAFPQGNGRVRLYLGYTLAQKTRLAGENAPKHFLEAFNLSRCRRPGTKASPTRRPSATAIRTRTRTPGRTSRSPMASCSWAIRRGTTTRSSARASRLRCAMCAS